MSKAMKLEDFLKMYEDGNPDQYLHLQPGEHKCSNCCGTGDDFGEKSGDLTLSMCKKCGGTGKINWIQNVITK